jgi:hypothetical protein
MSDLQRKYADLGVEAANLRLRNGQLESELKKLKADAEKAGRNGYESGWRHGVEALFNSLTRFVELDRWQDHISRAKAELLRSPPIPIDPRVVRVIELLRLLVSSDERFSQHQRDAIRWVIQRLEYETDRRQLAPDPIELPPQPTDESLAGKAYRQFKQWDEVKERKRNAALKDALNAVVSFSEEVRRAATRAGSIAPDDHEAIANMKSQAFLSIAKLDELDDPLAPSQALRLADDL